MDIPSSFSSPLPTVVVGAGVAGLACATKLAQAGVKVQLIEATSHGGGRARSFFDPDLGATIDNGQHLFMGCYVETMRMLRRIGSKDKIRMQEDLEVHLARPEGQGSLRLRCPTLPAPLHVASGLLRMRGLSLHDRLSVLRLGLALNHELQRPDDQESCDTWLRRMGQSEGLRRTFWDPLIWGTLNEDPLACSAAMLLAVLKRGFASTQRASCFGVSTVGLNELYVDPGLRYLRERGCDVRMGMPVRSLEAGQEQEGPTLLLGSGERIVAQRVVLAVPPDALGRLLKRNWGTLPALQSALKLEHAPIVNLWAQLDRPLGLPYDFVGLLESPLHWIFERGKFEAGPEVQNLISVTISGARAQIQDSVETLEAMLQSELGRFFGANAPKIVAFRAFKSRRATLRHAVGSYRQRPSCDPGIPGVLLAGDWLRTGLPATIESAAQSGHEAAQKILHERGLHASPTLVESTAHLQA